MKKTMKKEFWKVCVSDLDVNDRFEVYVFAANAAEAESKGLRLMDKEMYKQPYCRMAEHVGYIEA